MDIETPVRGIHNRFQYKWIALSVTTVGALMASIDSNIVLLGLPSMMGSLHANLIQMIWVIMAYILVSTVLLLAIGRVADIFGRERLYNWGFVVFTIGSAMCGFSQDANQLILFRVVQGIGGALMMVNSMAIITDAFPPNQRGRALGINSITFSVGGVAGPILGGLILAVADWRWIFFINIPIGIFGALWAFYALKNRPKAVAREKFDFVGAATFSTSLVGILAAVTLGIAYSWVSVPILSLFTLFAVMLVIFWWWERRSKNPMLDFSLFKNRVYAFSVFAATMQGLALFAVNFLIVFYMQGVRGFSPLMAALLLIPLPIVNSIVAPIAGVIADRIGARVPATVGLIIQGSVLVWLTQLTVSLPYWQIAIGLACLGIGGGLFFPPNTSAAMSNAPRHQLGVGSATLGTFRQVGMVMSLAITLAVAASSLPSDVMQQLFVGTSVTLGSASMQAFVIGMHSAFWLSLALVAVAAFFSVVRGKEDRKQLVEIEQLTEERTEVSSP